MHKPTSPQLVTGYCGPVNDRYSSTGPNSSRNIKCLNSEMAVIANPTQRLSRPSSRSPVRTVLTHTLYHSPEPPKSLQCIPAISDISCISGGRPTHPGPASQPIPGFSCPSRAPARTVYTYTLYHSPKTPGPLQSI